MRKTLLGTNADGSPHYHYEAEAGEHAVLTGPIKAVVTASDGTVYDVSEDVVGVPDHHLAEVLHGIHKHYEEHGHPEFRDGVQFVAPSFEETEQVANTAIAARKAAEQNGD